MSVRLGPGRLDPAAAFAELAGPGLGGIVLFVGRVRPDRLGGRPIRALTYEADRAFALGQLAALGREAITVSGARRVVLWHRTGPVGVGEASVIVGAAARHRSAAFDVAEQLIDRVKTEVALWKVAPARSARPPRRPRARRRSGD